MPLNPSLAAWFGDTAGDVSAEQAEQLNALHADIESRWPDDDASTRTAVLTGARQIVLGDATLESITNDLDRARSAEYEQRMIQRGAILASSTGARSGPGSEADLIARTGAARATIRKVLGRP